jgi:hypothetical protein
MTPETFTLVCEPHRGKKRLAFTAPARYAKFVQSLGFGQELRCVLSDPARDLKHNSKLHGVLHEVADALGWDTSEFKEYILPILRPAGECPITGKVLRQRTHVMTDQEIDQLVMEIKAWTQHHMPGFVFRFDQEHAA